MVKHGLFLEQQIRSYYFYEKQRRTSVYKTIKATAMSGTVSAIFRSLTGNKDQSSTRSIGSSKKEEPIRGNKPFKCFILLTGKTLNSHNDLMDRLKRKVPDLQVVQTEAECDIILVFCPVIRGPEHDIKAALEKLNNVSDTKPAVLVVLYITFDAEHVVSDYSRAVSRGNTLTVSCLFHEDRGLLQCQKNEESVGRIVTYITPQIQRIKSAWEKMEIDRSCLPTAYTDSHSVIPKKITVEKRVETGQSRWQSRNTTLKYFILLTGRTLNTDEIFMSWLKREIPQLQQVSTVDQCDVILTFCPVVSRAGTDIEAAVRKLNLESAYKPAVLVVLHRTFNPEHVVPDSSRSVRRENTVTVDCLFCEDQGLLKCRKNQDSFTRIIKYIKPQIPQKLFTEKEKKATMQPGSSYSLNKENIKQQQMKRRHSGSENTTLNYYILLTGQTLNIHEIFMSRLKCEIPQLQQVSTVDQCDVILAFCPVVSRAGTDIEAAVRKLNQESADKPAVLVALHHTFNPEHVVPDSSRIVRRENTVTVDCLFYEDQGLLKCPKNHESFTRIIKYIKPQTKAERTNMEPRAVLNENADRLKYFIVLTGHTLNTRETFMGQLEHEIPQLQKADTVDQCDFILAFCPIVSQAGTDIEAALKKLNQESAIKPTVLVVLHDTFNPECVVPDSSRNVNRENTVTFDCLFNEDQGLLLCAKNQESFTRIINYIKLQFDLILPTEERMETEETLGEPAKKRLKYFIYQMENTPKSYKDFMIEQMPDLQEVKTKRECDFILSFCPGVLRDGTDFSSTLRHLEGISDKHVVLVKLCENFHPECVVPGNRITVNSNNVLLKHQESMHSSGNDEHDREDVEQVADGASKTREKLENEVEPNENKQEIIKIELQKKDQQLHEMKALVDKLQNELEQKTRQLENREGLLNELEMLLKERYMQVE